MTNNMRMASSCRHETKTSVSRDRTVLAIGAPAGLGAELAVEYFGERYPVTVAVVGSAPLFDPENTRMKG